jgi:hypothetical protein
MLGLGRLEGRVEQFLTHQSRHEDRLNNHDQRLGVLERDKSSRSGAYWLAGTLGAAVSAIVGLFATLKGMAG